MIEDLLRQVAKENFGKSGNFFPCTHGRISDIKPLVLMVKKERSFWERPLRKYEYTIVAGMKEYVVKGKENDFLDALNLHTVKEDSDLVLEEDDDDDDDEDDEEEDGQGAASEVEFGLGVANCADAKIRISEDLGFLVLGKVDQEYIRDPDLRDILANTELDRNKMKAFEGHRLRLITNLIYSARFELKGKRKMEVEVDAGANVPSQVYAQLKGHFRKRVIPPKMAKRNTRGPFLFKVCRVVYNEQTNRLELPKGEIVGKSVHRAVDEEDEEDEEYQNTVAGLESGERDLAESFIDEDAKSLERIRKSVLLPTKDREERKARVNKYLHWFEDALAKKQKTFSLDAPLSDADREFLQAIFVPALPHHSMVDFSRLTDEKIQGYAIVLKIIADLSDDKWDEIEKAWAESG